MSTHKIYYKKIYFSIRQKQILDGELKQRKQRLSVILSLMTAEEQQFTKIGGYEVRVGSAIMVGAHGDCLETRGEVIGITGGDIKVSCKRCGRTDIFIDIKSTGEFLSSPRKNK